MKQLDELKEAEDAAFEKARAEEAAFEAEDIAGTELDEYEVVNPAEMGFSMDGAGMTGEADPFYMEDDLEEAEKAFAEDVTDCAEQEVEEAEGLASIQVDVFNEDGFGAHFAQEVMKTVPGVEAVKKGEKPNKDVCFKLVGSVEDLKKAFAFYLGRRSFAQLDPEDQSEFNSALVFDDGDTLAEADYREAVAHCLDPVDVKASTANLVSKDACAISVLKEEKIRRQAAKMRKALCENDFSSLSDKDLEKLDQIKDALDADEELSQEDKRIWAAILEPMGYTPEEWDELSPEEQDKRWKAYEDYQRGFHTKTGFAQFHTGVDPKTGKRYRYQNTYEIYDPKTGEKLVTAFNPNYSKEDSILQNRGEFERQARRQAKVDAQANREQAAKDAMRRARGARDEKGKATWQKADFVKMISALDSKQRKELMNQLIDDVKADHKDNPTEAGKEIQVIKTLFGKKLTLRDYAAAWGAAHTGVDKYMDETMRIWRQTMN